MIIIENKVLPPKNYSAIMLFGILFVRKGVKVSDRTIRHESIHVKQMLEMLILPFYLWYCIEFVIRLCFCRDWSSAYRNISFEKEAYQNESQIHYKRKFYSWLKYL